MDASVSVAMMHPNQQIAQGEDTNMGMRCHVMLAQHRRALARNC
jgi:hypothetical protein